MAYTRLNLKDGDTLTGADMTHIEDELVALEDADSEINQSLTEKAGWLGLFTDLESLTAAIIKTETNSIYLFNVTGALRSDLSGGIEPNTVMRGFISRSATDQNNYFVSTYSRLYCGRINDSGEIVYSNMFVPDQTFN